MEGGKRQTSFRFDTETVDEDHFQERVAEWIHELAEFDGQATILQKKEMPENEVILGKESGRWYLATSTDKEEVLKEELMKDLRLLGAANEKGLLNTSNADAQENKSSGIVDMQMPHKGRNHVTSFMRQESIYMHIIAWLQRSPSTVLRKSEAGNMSCNRNLILFGKQYLRGKILNGW